ncbi:MAG: hypothetical protein ABI464_14940 [Chthoniobacteraceae bacterium]
MADLFLILGVFALSVALRTTGSLLLNKLGVIGYLATSFLAGWRLTGSLLMGAVFMSFWLVWPWYELITRVRKIAMPADGALRHKTPPHREMFPALDDLTGEIEGEGFEHAEDLGRDWDDIRQFFRVFHKSDERVQAVICLVEQENFAFYYLRLVSRAADGTIWTTWNYPFALNLKLAPEWRTNRDDGGKTFTQLLGSHRDFLAKNNVLTEALTTTDPAKLAGQLHEEQNAQIAHNLTAGILARGKDGAIRYTWRGLVFIWFQFLRDFVRLH